MNNNPNKLVGILLVFYDDLKHIPRLAKSLTNQHYKDFNIYCLDNNSEKEHIKYFRKYYSEVIELSSTENSGFAKGNNMLAEKAVKDGCKYLFVLNPDMEPEPSVLETMVRFMDINSSYALAGPLILHGDSKENPKIQLFGSQVNFKTQEKSSFYANAFLNDCLLEDHLEVDMVNAGSAFVRTDFLQNKFLFEERYFMYNDEIDLARRVKEDRCKIAVLSRAIVWHYHDWSSGNIYGYLIMYYYMMRNKMLYYYKFGMQKRALLEFVRQMALFPVVLKFCLRTSGFKLVIFYYLGLLHGLLNKQGRAIIKFDS